MKLLVRVFDADLQLYVEELSIFVYTRSTAFNANEASDAITSRSFVLARYENSTRPRTREGGGGIRHHA
jgi:hypothetical protein